MGGNLRLCPYLAFTDTTGIPGKSHQHPMSPYLYLLFDARALFHSLITLNLSLPHLSPPGTTVNVDALKMLPTKMYIWPWSISISILIEHPTNEKGAADLWTANDGDFGLRALTDLAEGGDIRELFSDAELLALAAAEEEHNRYVGRLLK